MRHTKIENVLREKLFEFNRHKKYGAGVFDVSVNGLKEQNEVVDFMSLDGSGTMRAFKIQPTLSEYRNNKWNELIADYNYVVLPKETFDQLGVLDVTWGIGIVTEDEKGNLQIARKPSRHKVSLGLHTDLMECMLNASSRD